MIPHKAYKRIKKLKIFNSIKSFKALEKKIEAINTKDKFNLRGDVFEIFIQGLLLNDSNYNAKVVYPSLKQTPVHVRKKLKVKSVDRGIDGVFINQSDDIIPYQVKFRSFQEPAEMGDTLKIEHQGKHASQRYYFYNSKSITEEFFDEEKKNIAVGPNELEKLDSNFFKRFEQWFSDYKVPEKKRTKIDGYQKITINKVKEEFKIANRATIAMACGSGKSLISFWIAEELKFKTIVVFVPSKALLKQIREEWLREKYLHGIIEHISIFSERESSEYDTQELDQSELSFKIFNKKEDINKFLKRKTTNTKIVFCTYQSSPLLSSSMPKNFSFNYGVFDEAHKTTSNKIIKKGSKQKFSWNMPLQEKFIKINKRLFMTATLRKANFKKQNKLGYEQINYSMKNESQYGRIVDEFTFVKARKEGVICPIKVIVSVVTNEELHFKNISKTAVNIESESIKTEQVAHQIAIKRAVEKFNSKKIFTYHSRCEDAFSFTKNAPEGIKTHLPSFECAYIDGSMSLKDRDDVMETFKDTKKGLISNARCLIEGVNIPAVDMVTFVSPKSSAVDIVQASGRAMRVRGLKDKKYGYILLPIFVERFRGEKISRAINRTDFTVVLKFLKALSDYDETIKEEISQKVIDHFRKKGRKQKQRAVNKKKEIENTKLEFIGNSFETKDIEDSIDIKIINFFGLRFEEYLAKLMLYKEKFGNTDVPYNSKGKYKELGIWVNKLRTIYRNNNLNNFRKKQLDKIGFNWNFEGETLSSIEGLINLNDFAEKLGINKETFKESILDKNIIKPYGFRRSYPFTSKILDEYFQSSQLEDVYRKLNITIKNTDRYLTLKEFEDYTSISRKKITELIEKDRFIPAGYGRTLSTLSSPYFKKEQKKELLSLFDADGIRLLKITTQSVKEKIRFDKLTKEPLISAVLLRDLIKKIKLNTLYIISKVIVDQRPIFFIKK
jgi:predicted helicase